MRKAVYAGSFDPLTNGHLWMIREGSRLFDELIVSIGINPQKKNTFSLDERIGMLKRCSRDFPNVIVDSFENSFLVNYAASKGAQYLLRGIRNEGDYEYERGMRYINRDLNPGVSTAFLVPDRELVEVSSSLVKGLIGPEGWEGVIEGLVPRHVYNQLLTKFRGLEGRWNKLWTEIGADGSGKEAFDRLLKMYGEKGREYHNFVHIAHVLRELDEVKELAADRQVELALWYHDAVYDTRAKDNEEKSAELVGEEFGKTKVNAQLVEKSKLLVLATKHQKSPETHDEKLLVDIDLSILGRPEKEFDEYERDIRSEYAWVPEEQFRQGRKRILQSFLDRSTIYSTDFFRNKYELKARENLKRSLAQLN